MLDDSTIVATPPPPPATPEPSYNIIPDPTPEPDRSGFAQADPERADAIRAHSAVEVQEMDAVLAALRPTIGELLQGATMPYNLLPVPDNVVDPEQHRIFISRHTDAAQVGTAFADELSRLGYRIEPSGFDEAVAVRGDTSLSMRMVPDAALVYEQGRRMYPTAEGADVALEVWVGRDGPPR